MTHKHVLNIALTAAKDSQDPDPIRIEMATGPLKRAWHVLEPEAKFGTLENAKEVVDLVVIHGYFHLSGTHPPPGHEVKPGKIMCLILNAQTGMLRGRSLSDAMPLPLSRLGRVVRLR